MRVMLGSYEQVSFIRCLHWKHMCWVHFIMCLHWIRYLVVILDMCLMPLAVCAWWLFFILTFVTHCYHLGLGLSGPSTYRLWLWYKVCRNVLVMDSCISQW